MRKALNDNPLVQVAVLGVIGIIVGYMFLTRMGGSEPPPEPTATADAPAEAAATASAASPSGAVEPAPATGGVSVAPTGAAGFKAGPGLPRGVVDAYADGKVVVLLVVRERGIDDKRLKAIVEALRARSDTVVFVTNAVNIARYARITEGVDVDRTPALVVLGPKRLNRGPLPEATVSYGFRSVGSVTQAVNDALYKGPADLPYYPQ